MYRNAAFALAVLLALIVGVLIGSSMSRADAQGVGNTPRAVGTFQLAAADDHIYAMDTCTGRLWSFDHRGWRSVAGAVAARPARHAPPLVWRSPGE